MSSCLKYLKQSLFRLFRIFEENSSKVIQVKTTISASESLNNQVISNSFIDEIKESEPRFDFSSSEISFLTLPEMKAYGQPYIELSTTAQDYFYNLDRLFLTNPDVALKLIIILACHDNQYFYTEKIKDIIVQKLLHCFIEGSLTGKERLELGIQCWLYWPQKHGRLTKDIFIDPLIQLFVQVAGTDPEYILTKFDLVAERSEPNYIFSMTEGHQDKFLEFARNLKQQRPELLILGLQRCLQDAYKEYGSYSNYRPTESYLRSVTKELFDILQDQRYAGIVHYQCICRDLILYAYPDEQWYSTLFPILWVIEESNINKDPRNCFLIVLNAPNGYPLLGVVQAYFREWAFNYQYFDVEKPKEFVDHAEKLINLINDACREQNSYIRNKSFLSSKDCILVVDALDAYWQMAGWLRIQYPKLYFYVLNKGLENIGFDNTFTAEQIKTLGNLAKIKFIEMFESFCKEHSKDAAEIVEYMVERSHYSFIDIHLYQMLEKIYPVLLASDPLLAQQALERGSSGRGYEREYWYPGKKCFRRY